MSLNLGPHGKSLYLGFPNVGKTYILPLRRNGLPMLPANGISSPDDLVKMKAVVAPPEVNESGGTPSLYAFTRMTVGRNLYRIPLQ